MTQEAVVSGIDSGVVATRAGASPTWLASRRRAAWEAFSTLPWPSSLRDEDWRRTDIAKLDPLRFDPDAGVSTELDSVIAATHDDIAAVAPDAAVIVCDHTGRVQLHNCDALTAQGVIVCSLSEAATRHRELVEQAFDTLPAGQQPLTALWNSLWRDGCFVYVPPSVAANQPVWVIHAAADDRTATFPATCCVLDANASLTLVELHVSPATAQAELLSDTVSHVVLNRNARLDYCVLQDLGQGVWHMATHRVSLEADAHLHFFGATLGSKLQKAYWEALLNGNGAEAHLAGIALAGDRQHLDHQSLQAHKGTDTTSRLLLKTAVRDHARSVYDGLIDVGRTAQRTDAYVQNRNLILSPDAKADSIPRLEIRAHDVRCGHGAAAGPVDDEQRFYLMARGIPAEIADRIIVRGFFEDALGQAPCPEFAALLGPLLDRRLDRILHIGRQES